MEGVIAEWPSFGLYGSVITGLCGPGITELNFPVIAEWLQCVFQCSDFEVVLNDC